MIKSKIIHIFAKFNILISRDKVVLYTFLFNNSNNYIIEFLGPSGIGKSYLINKIMNILPTEKSIFYVSISSNKNNVYLSKFERKLTSNQIRMYLSNSKIYTYNAKNRIKKYFSLIETEKQLNNFNYGTLWDEGLVYYFRDSLISLSETNKDEIYSMLKKRLIINIIDNVDDVYNKILYRKKLTGNMHFNHRNSSKSEIFKMINETLEKNKEFIKFFDNLVPNQSFTIDYSKDFESQLISLVKFVEKLTNQRLVVDH